MRLDLPLHELREYRPEVAEPQDFDAFWASTLVEARQHSTAPRLEPLPSPFPHLELHDVRLPGFGGDPIAAWLLLPRGGRDLPGMVVFQGYGGGRGLPHEWLPWPSAGFATLVVDTRGQGARQDAAEGGTPDPGGTGSSVAGFTTRGIESPEDYYYRRVLTDAARAVDALRAHPAVDPARVATTGVSQGGGIALAAAGLVPEVALCMPDVPFLCHFERAVGFADQEPYAEIVRWLRTHRGQEEQVFRTLSYIDGVAFARRAAAEALFSVALQDAVCPPSTVFAAYNAYTGAKAIEVYPFNGHEGGGSAHWAPQLATARRVLGA